MIVVVTLFIKAKDELMAPEAVSVLMGGVPIAVVYLVGISRLSTRKSSMSDEYKVLHFIMKSGGRVRTIDLDKVVKVVNQSVGMIYLLAMIQKGEITGEFNDDKSEFFTGQAILSRKQEVEEARREHEEQERTNKAIKERQRIETLRKIVAVTESLEIDRLAKVLEIDSEEVWKNIFDWASKFGFKIKDDKIIFGTGDISGFVSELDRHFSDWDEKSKERTGKI